MTHRGREPRITTLGLAKLRRLPPEWAHALALRGLPWVPAEPLEPPAGLATRLSGRSLAHPLGLAAGFDKEARAVTGLVRLGFAFVEVGTVTPRPQPGNPRPRLFRLETDRALINRMGFNNAGLHAFCGRLAGMPRPPIPIGVNIGVNKDSADPLADFAAALASVAPLADYVAVNVSSPNTAGLRDLQRPEKLGRLLRRLETRRSEADRRPALFLKIAPDLDDEALAGAVATAIGEGVAGLIVGNTTTSRPPDLKGRHRCETGGLSGAPLFALATDRLRLTARLARGRLELVGVGGIFSGADAYAKIRAGASAVQLYTALVLEGPAVVGRVLQELRGFSRLEDAIGVDV